MDFYAIVKDDMQEVEKQIESYLTGKDERIYGPLLPFIKRGGKRIRPLLAFVSFRAFGGQDVSKLKKLAALIEMFHNFTLVHDDIEDDSKFRRGEPTLHVQHGIPIALNSGDALYTLIWQELASLDIDKAKLNRIMKMYAKAFAEVADGQGIELYWERNNRFDITEKDYFAMIEKKTAALIGLSSWIGAYLADAPEKEQNAVEEYGRRIGTAFQIHDDVLNISGDFKKYQKEIGGDITEGKRTLMIVKALEKGEPGDKERLRKMLSSHTDNPAEIKQVIDILKKYKTLDYAEEKARAMIEDAKRSIRDLKQSPYKDAFTAIADFVITRER